jgi:hypothetical protein
MEAASFPRDIEAAYRQMWHIWSQICPGDEDQ